MAKDTNELQEPQKEQGIEAENKANVNQDLE